MRADRETLFPISNCSSCKEYVINLCSGILLEKLRVVPPFMEPQGSLLCSVKPATGPYHVLLESCVHSPPSSSKIHFNITKYNNVSLSGILRDTAFRAAEEIK
jgi:hypothetical protein